MADTESYGHKPPGTDNRIVKVSGKAFITGNTSSGIRVVPLSPGIDTRLDTVSTTYQLYRFTWLKFIIHVPISGIDFIVAFTPDAPDDTSVPASFEQAFELPYCWFMGGVQTVPRFEEINRRGLLRRNATLWWECNGATGTTQEVDQGKIFILGGVATTAHDIELEYVCEFTNPIPAPLSIAALKEKLTQLEEKHRPTSPCVEKHESPTASGVKLVAAQMGPEKPPVDLSRLSNSTIPSSNRGRSYPSIENAPAEPRRIFWADVADTS